MKNCILAQIFGLPNGDPKAEKIAHSTEKAITAFIKGEGKMRIPKSHVQVVIPMVLPNPDGSLITVTVSSRFPDTEFAGKELSFSTWLSWELADVIETAIREHLGDEVVITVI
ncbi:MAG: hypothetical protein COY66_02785 [Candidatus Kerfeldbacteria bacterium CG_4_10_14_0_8_um_filter_42_10]|uniref:Uncharacterized protein n=1 Tax=Candidatus Kerfeldbacteria bacterium CG_4_10_14_0_8_um_filter_42_10 TaxID=2014248 RepID=A0A2M7RJ95_9BACT|nr:MAG: hypothetical protein COY66_02785 [Candidatus Kerfeldbacteria bacterium CG_4_10_14_0_8_um_filter_42_10]